jgi:outer membrane protein assembly factor BamB
LGEHVRQNVATQSRGHATQIAGLLLSYECPIAGPSGDKAWRDPLRLEIARDEESRDGKRTRALMGCVRWSDCRQRLVVRLFVAAGMLIGCCGALTAEEWSQFRGPNGQGRSEQTGLPISWSEDSNIVWKIPIEGLGWSSPVMAGNQIWVTTATKHGHSLRAIRARLDNGKVERDVEVFAPANPVPLNPKNSHASPSPLIEKGRVYVHYGAMGTACLSADTGDVLWRNENLVIDHKEGPGSSPILFENLLIVNCDGQDRQFVAALDKASGKIVWQTTRSVPYHCQADFRKAYSTPALIEIGGRTELVSTGANQTNVLDPRTGKEIWRVQYNGFSNIPVPLIGGDRVYVMTDFIRPQLWAIRADGHGDVTGSHVLWKITRQVGSSPTPVLAKGRIYLVTDQGVATCAAADTGKVLWQHRIGGTFSASVVALGEHIYFSSEQGKVTVIRPADKWSPVATNELGGRIFATPAVAGRSLILRTDSHLYRVEAAPATTSTPRDGRR